MKIDASTVQMDSAARRFKKVESIVTSSEGELRTEQATLGASGNSVQSVPNQQGIGQGSSEIINLSGEATVVDVGRPQNPTGVVVGISEQAKVLYQQEQEQFSFRASDVSYSGQAESVGESTDVHFSSSDLAQTAVNVMLKGSKAAIHINQSAEVQQNRQEVDQFSSVEAADLSIDSSLQTSDTAFRSVGVNTSGLGLMEVSQYTHSYTEQSQIYNGYGTVSTADGREINFGLYLAMDRKETVKSEAELIVNVQPMVDPLVINFGAESVTLTDQYFQFDIDSDGVNETIATLGKGSGYLMLDRNGNGKADDGSELFGPQTGQGFAELAEFDSDGNMWIDESDPIFEELKVWVSDENGVSSLMGLKETGAGAIFLGSSDADFDLVSKEGLPLANIKANGLMLMENGEVRSVQEIDLVDHSLGKNSDVDVMTTDEMAEEIEQFNELGPEIQETEESKRINQRMADIADAIARLDTIREEQKAERETINLEQEEQKTVTELLVDAMEEFVFQTEEPS